MYCTRFEDEMYKCPVCGKFFTNDNHALSKTWECPDCLEPLHIGVPSMRLTLIRKLPTDIKKYDSIFLRGEAQGRTVLAINDSIQKNKVSVSVEGYGRPEIPKDEYQNIVIGRYVEESWIPQDK